MALVERLRAAGELGATRTLGVYSHVDHDVKVRAEGAGFDLVVPRSRMAREGAALVERLRYGFAWRVTSVVSNARATSSGRSRIPKRRSQAAHARRTAGRSSP